ncbi:TIGR01777 family oxidoreductase [Virgibacillus halodenitrificans]|jgi:uncharacterized protein|uniref:TIGR01777 family protein n=1 Tax=Virgibacillus halodenitrificans TaxID=1482 RepID=A0ABR7VS83_VIRHA|nr:TIGR01777 family oxidoreductase [Virgibacillus halodenitrificans]MBD1224755.1 TIGR01777 family protein [Virgibacillus halodenitrificans]MEC2159304.1 TIGR01777 family oxidoreductase [Virgibacillus halodenitrificans]MYL45800.1 TIGR01777 family protein [Virgibacillus halodenitrificans]WHX24950.1 TIGR01777 family oxidoreductase [Virgibacillus halodenitrificans]
MNILITGGTGFVGKHLTASLHKKDHHTYILTRSPENKENTNLTTFIGYDYPAEKLPVIHAVVNLAGESLFGYWSKKKKDAILSSRINTTNHVIDLLQKMKTKPDVLISGSAVGYYGTSEDLIFTEATKQSGNDFLAHVTTQWEKAAKKAEDFNIRTVYTRFGVILGEEGSLPYMQLPVKLFAGGKIGNGEQWLSWVHVEDVVRLLEFCIFNKEMKGPINVTSPHPKRNKDFMRSLANVLHRPYWLPVPSPLIRLVVGEMAILVNKGQYVLPQKALDNQFEFSFPYLKEALQHIKQRHQDFNK